MHIRDPGEAAGLPPGKKRPRSSYFAYLFAPFGGLNKNESSRPLVTKYVGRGAPIGTSLAFHFNSEGRVPRDEAHMWIMASNEEQTEYDGGYVSRNIDRKNRPGVRWITLTFLTADVSIESIDEHCTQYVRSADDLAREAAEANGKPASKAPAPRTAPKDVLTRRASSGNGLSRHNAPVSKTQRPRPPKTE